MFSVVFLEKKVPRLPKRARRVFCIGHDITTNMAAKEIVRSLGCFRSFVPVIRSAQRKERPLLSLNRTRYNGESWQRVKFRRLSSNPEPVSDDVTEVKSDGLQLSDSCVKVIS